MFVQFRGERYGLDHSELVAQSEPRASVVLYAVKTTNNEPLEILDHITSLVLACLTISE